MAIGITGLTREEVTSPAVVFGAEAAGVAAWAMHTAAEFATVREQVGHPVGQFQGAKHRCARMATAVERARAVVWDAARAVDQSDDSAGASARLAASVAAVVALDAALSCTRDCVQVLGGIGFTREHDARRYLRRASTLRALCGHANDWAVTVADLALAGHRRAVELEVDDDASRELAIEPLGQRQTLKQLAGAATGAEASVRKLLGVEFNQAVADCVWEHQGSAAVYEDTSAASGIWARFMLFGRSMTIYGGTTEVPLNIIGERLLGFPRDPETYPGS